MTIYDDDGNKKCCFSIWSIDINIASNNILCFWKVIFLSATQNMTIKIYE